MNKVSIISDPLSASHHTTLASQCEVGEVVNPSVELSHPPTPPTLDIYKYLACKPIYFHMKLFYQPLSSRSIDPPDCTTLCSPVSEFTFVVHEDKVVDRFGFEQPTYTVIYDDYVWEFEEEFMVKDDLLPSTPHLLSPYIFWDSAIFYLSYENPSLNVFTYDHSQTHRMSVYHLIAERIHLYF